MKEKFDKKKYDKQYVKIHYKPFNVSISKDLSLALEKKLDSIGMTKSQFLRNAIDDLLNK